MSMNNIPDDLKNKYFLRVISATFDGSYAAFPQSSSVQQEPGEILKPHVLN